MKKINYLFLVILSICCIFLTGCSTDSYTNEIITKKVEYEENITIYDLEDALVEAVEKASPSVIGVEASLGFNAGFGSGVIIKHVAATNTYYVVTNYHVVTYNDRICSKISVYLGDYNETIVASCIEYSKTIDIAILSFRSYRELTCASIGDSTTYKKGRFAIAIGSPYDLKTFYDSVTIGNVSDPCRQCLDDNNNLNYYIQHTAAINGGNSGGGLFDIHGNLMGINTWKYAEVDIEGMCFSVPIHVVKEYFGKYFA